MDRENTSLLANKKRAARDDTPDDEAHPTKMLRTSSDSFFSKPLSPDLHDTGLRLPFSLTTEGKKKGPLNSQSTSTPKVNKDLSLISAKKAAVKLNLTPSTSPPKKDHVVAPSEPPVVSYSGFGAINLADENGKIIATRDPRGGHGYESDANFTPETSFSSNGSAKPKVLPPGTVRALFYNTPEVKVSFGSLKNNADDLRSDDDTDDGSSTVVGDSQDIANTEDLAPSSQSSFAVGPIIRQDSSFEDLLVYRRQGDTSFTSPSVMPCSALATNVDITKVERAASTLLASHPSSEEACSSLLSRLERMMSAQIRQALAQAKASREKPVVPKPEDAAKQLREYLVGQKEVRMELGDEKERLEMEVAWADWLVETTASGVMHLKVPGCTCRPDLVVGEEWL